MDEDVFVKARRVSLGLSFDGSASSLQGVRTVLKNHSAYFNAALEGGLLVVA